MTDSKQGHDTDAAGARDTASRVYHDARDKAADALSSTTASAQRAAQRAAQSVDANPLGIIVGGLAIGALAGALIPRSAKEKELLAPLGKTLGESAKRAVQAAREAGMQQLDEHGLTKDAVKDRSRELAGGVGKALSSVGQAAVQSAKSPSDARANADDQGSPNAA